MTPVIRFPCEKCGEPLAMQDSKAGATVPCPHCKAKVRVPHESPGDEETLAFSPSKMRMALVWVVCFQLLSLIVLVGCVFGVVMVVLKEPVSFKMLLAVCFASLLAVVAFCYLVLALPNWRLFFASTVPSSSHYLLTDDRLVRYSRDDEIVEEIPFANIESMRMMIKRDEEDPDIKARVMGIDLKDLEDPDTTLDPQFNRWSQKMHDYDVVLIEDFFESSLKSVHKKIKKRWQRWQETHPNQAKAESTQRARPKRAWYQKPLTYVLGGAGVAGIAGLVVLLIVLGRGGAAVPPPGPGPGPGPGAGVEPQGNKPNPEPFGPKSLPGLVAYWPLDEAQGTAVNDAAGKGAAGRLHGCEWIPGVKGSALKLNGKSDLVELAFERRISFPAAGPFTVAGWVATESGGGVISSFRSRASPFPVVEISVRAGLLSGWVRDDTSGFGGAKVSGAKVNDGKWRHVALTRQGDGTVELFLDGASQGSDKGKSSGGPITTDLLALGCDLQVLNVGKKTPAHLAGTFDEFCVYDRLLAAPEIASLATRKQP
jgi:hypothetical protein